MVVVRFKVGEAEEAALVRLNQKLAANADRIPPGVVGPHRQAPLDRRRADHGGHRLVGALRRRPAAGAGRAAARRDRRSHRRLRGDAHRRAAASAAGGCRSGAARRLRAGSARGPARDRRDQRAQHRVGHGRRATSHRPRSGQPAADGRRRPSRRRRAARAAGPCSWATSPSRATAMPSPRPMSRISHATAGAHPGGHDRRGQAQGHQRHRRRAPRRAQKLDTLQGHAGAVRRAPHDHPRLRRDGGREEQRAALAHAARRALGVGAHLARPRAGAKPRWCSSPFRSRSR